MSAKTKKEDFIIKLLFVLLVFLLPTQIAYHFWPRWAFIFGIRVDYFSPTLYLTDVLIVLLFVLTLFQNRRSLRSFVKRLAKKKTSFLFVVVFVFINVFFAFSPVLSFYKWIKILEMFFLVLFVAYYKKLNFEKWFLKPLILSSVVFSLLGLAQFIKSATIGFPFVFFGERTFSISTPGIALMTVNGRDYLRAYSTFPHPNALAGYLGIVLILLFFYKKTINQKLFVLAGATALSCLLFSFSLGAIISLITIFVVYQFLGHKREFYFSIFLLVLVFSLFLLPSAKTLLSKLSFSSHIKERILLILVAASLIKSHPLFGVGMGNFIIGLNNLRLGVPSWLLQPVHNIFLLIFSEVGLIGLLTFLVVTSKSLLKASLPIATCFLFIILTGAVDHYWLTLQQNLLLLAFILGFSFRRNLRLL